mgnify:CR=1 FL=1
MAGELLGFVGVGRMGGPMALRLLDAGYKLCVYDVSPEALKPFVDRGAQIASSPAEVASQAETVLLSLPMPDVVRSVALGGNDGVINGSKVKTVIDLSTTGPGAAAQNAGLLADLRKDDHREQLESLGLANEQKCQQQPAHRAGHGPDLVDPGVARECEQHRNDASDEGEHAEQREDPRERRDIRFIGIELEYHGRSFR